MLSNGTSWFLSTSSSIGKLKNFPGCNSGSNSTFEFLGGCVGLKIGPSVGNISIFPFISKLFTLLDGATKPSLLSLFIIELISTASFLILSISIKPGFNTLLLLFGILTGASSTP